MQKHAKQLNCDANSKRFKDAMRYLWMPHLVDADDHRRRLLKAAHHHHAADVAAAHGLSGAGMVTSASSDSFATTAESYDDVAGLGGGYAINLHATGEMAAVVGGGGGCWAHEANHQGLWPAAADQAGSGGQFQDPELSGWVQGFSEGMITENFWALEDIWKIQ